MTLESLRKKIDYLDIKIIELIGKRIAFSHEIGRLKRLKKLSIIDKKREQEVLQKSLHTGRYFCLPKSMTMTIFKAILKTSRQAQMLL